MRRELKGESNIIVDKAVHDWPDDYEMQLYIIKNQSEAYQRLNGTTAAKSAPAQSSLFDNRPADPMNPKRRSALSTGTK